MEFCDNDADFMSHLPKGLALSRPSDIAFRVVLHSFVTCQPAGTPYQSELRGSAAGMGGAACWSISR
jgi:hypothetical protein